MQRRSALVRIVRAVFIGALVLEGLYLVAMNVFLATPLFGKVINATPDVVDIHYARAWSFFPTRVTAKGLSLRATDSHIEWILRIEDVTFDCSLLELAQKHFHVTRARGSGITFRVRMKLASPEATPDFVAKLPTIDTLGPVAFIPSDPPYAGTWDDSKWHLFTVRLDDVVADHVHEVWMDTTRFEGDAKITGGFYLKPIRTADVSQTAIEVRSGQVLMADRVVVDGMTGHVDFKLDPFKSRTDSTTDILHDVTVSVSGRGAIPDLDALALSLPDSGQVWGRVEVPRFDLRIVKGVIRDGTHVDARSDGVRVTTAAHVVSGKLGLTANVAGDRLDAAMDLGDVDGDFALEMPAAHVAVDARALDLAGPLDDLHVVADVPQAEVKDGERIQDYLPKSSGVAIERGDVLAAGHVEGWRWDKRVSGNVRVTGKDLDARAAKARLRGTATVDARVGMFFVEKKRATDVSVALDVPEATMARSAAPADTLVHVRALHASAESAALDTSDPLRTFKASIALPEVDVFDPDSARATLGLGSDVWLTNRRATFDATAAAAFEDHRGTASIDVNAPKIALAYEDRRLVTDLQMKGRAHAINLHGGTLAIDEARVTAANVVLSDSAHGPALRVAHVTVAAVSPRFATKDPLAQVQVVGTLGGGELTGPSALRDLLPDGGPSFDATSGAFDADLAVAIKDHVASGAASIDAPRVGISGTKIHLVGDVGVTADIRKWDLKAKTLAGGARIAVAKVTGGFDPAHESTDFTADRLDVRADAESLDLAHPSMRDVDYGVRLGHAELADARALNTFLPSANIMLIESGSAALSADIGTSNGEQAAGGKIDVVFSHGGLRLHETHLVGDFALEVQAHGFDPDKGEVNVEGSQLAMRNVTVTGAATDTTAWGGELVMQEGTLRLAPAPRLEGDFTLLARDASPLLAVLLRDSVPKFVAQLTAMPHLTANMHLVVQPQALVASDVFASGGNLALRGFYAAHDSDVRAAFVVDKGPFSAGVRLGSDGAHLRLFGLREWFDEQRRATLIGKW